VRGRSCAGGPPEPSRAEARFGPVRTASPRRPARCGHRSLLLGGNEPSGGTFAAPDAAQADDNGATVNLQRFFENRGVEFPEGSWLRFDQPGWRAYLLWLDDLVSRTMQGNYNVINVLFLYMKDTAGSSHGAFWNSSIVPKTTAYPPEKILQTASAK